MGHPPRENLGCHRGGEQERDLRYVNVKERFFSLSSEIGHNLTEHLLAESVALNFCTMSVYSSI